MKFYQIYDQEREITLYHEKDFDDYDFEALCCLSHTYVSNINGVKRRYRELEVLKDHLLDHGFKVLEIESEKTFSCCQYI